MRLPHSFLTACCLAAAVFLTAAGSACGDVVWTLEKGWQRLPETDGAKVPADFDNAFNAYVTGKYVKARKLLARLAEGAGEGIPEQARILLAECYLGEKHYTKAFEKFEEFIEAYPASRYVDRACRGEVEIAQAVLGGARIKALGLRIWPGYSFGEKVVDKISSRRPLSDYARDAQLALARSYFRRHLYVESASAFQQYVELFGESPDAPQALLGVAKSLYLDAPGSGYDPLPYYRAAAASAGFVRQYEASPDARVAAEVSGKAREKLAEHYLLVAKYYLKTGKVDAAVMYFKKVADDYAGTRPAAAAKSHLGLLPAGK